MSVAPDTDMEIGHFWSVRSQRIWQSVGAGGVLVFLVLGIEARHVAAALLWDGAFLLISAALFANAFRTGHVRITPDRLVYQSVFRNRSFGRGELKGARIELRTRFPSPRTFNMPVLETSPGKDVAMPELCTPLSPSVHGLKAVIDVHGRRERSKQSLDGLTFWINTWIVSGPLIDKAETQRET